MSLAREDDTLIGRSLGEFVVRERIGEGGFGAVYRATQPTLDREAVIKVLHTRHQGSKAVAERFLREAKLASKLDHPYSAHIYAFGVEPDGELWIAMELVRGTPLDQILKLQGPLSLERFVPLLDRVCEVVHTAHEQGIVHRDLKPANVMVLARAGRLLPKLLDFGIAKGLASSGIATDETLQLPAEPLGFAHTLGTPVPGLTQRGAIMGSPPYMAPEQWLDAGQVDARTDLYALGILTYECLTGRPPYTGATLTAIAAAHSSGAPPPLGPLFPAALDKVLAKALAKDAAERYPDALAFAAGFRNAAGIATDTVALPALDPPLRDATINAAPQPIAEALAAFEAARNAHQARDALALLARAISRYLGILALACRSRVTAEDRAGELMRALTRQTLSDGEWLGLALELTRAWLDRRDAYPIPDLIGALHDGRVVEDLAALAGVRETNAPLGTSSDTSLITVLEESVQRLGRVLEALAFVRDYPLVVTGAGGYAERWMGVRRSQRTTIAVRGKGLPPAIPALLDRDGAPVLSLAPLVQVAAPTPGAPLDLFLFEGRDRRGAKLVALPSGFEHHDDALWDWFRAQLTGSLDETEASVAEERPPYRGLSAFSAEDGAMFVGREKLVDAFANRLKLQPLLAVVGRSGAGKSSFVHAGVVPALPAGWRAIAMRPGPSPLAALAARLEHAGFEPAVEWTTSGLAPAPRVSAGFPAVTELREILARDRDALGSLLRSDAARRGPVLLVVDQLEELFTLCHDPDERRVFADAVASAARAVEDPVRVVFTLRDDFLVRTEQVPALRNRISQGLQILTVPVAEDLLRIVTEPARRVGYEFDDPGLPAEMVKEVADQPGALALISFTASKLWELRDRHFKQLTRVAYKTLGGVGGALARHADRTLEAMLPEERALTREAFRHLVTSQNTRATLERKELLQLLGNTAHGDGVIEKLVSQRLLVASENESGGETIEIVHEALLVAWPRLVEWRREDLEGARLREQLRTAAKQWDDRGRADGLLWRGDALGDYVRWRARHAGPMTDLEVAFSDASLAAAARGRRIRNLVVAASFGVLVAVVVGLAIFTARLDEQRADAVQARDDAKATSRRQYEEEGRLLVLAGDPFRALAYLGTAGAMGSEGFAHDLLVGEAVRAIGGEILEVRHDNAVRSPRFSPDGTKLITGGFDQEARIWDAGTGARLLTLHHTGVVVRATFSPDGKTALTASFDGTAALWDTTSGRRLRVFPHTGWVWCAQYSPDGTLAVTAGADDTVAVWDLQSGAERFRVHGAGAGVTACAFSRDGAAVAAGDAAGVTRLWDVRTGAPMRTLEGQVKRIRVVQFASDDKRLLTASEDGTAVEWSVATGDKVHVLRHEDAEITSAEYSPDGRLIATSSTDHTAAVWDVATGSRVVTLVGHTARVIHVAFSPDGSHVVTASADAVASLWDTRTGAIAARWRHHEDVVVDAEFDPSGRRVVTAGDDGRAVIWDVQSQDRTTWLRGHTGLVRAAAFSSDGEQVATAGEDGTARIWDARSGTELRVLRGHDGAVIDVGFGPGGRELVTGGDDGTVRVWSADGKSHLLPASGTAKVHMVSWSPDGKIIVAGTEDGALRCWDVATGSLRFEAHGGNNVVIVSVSVDRTSSEIVTTGEDGVIRFWSLDGRSRGEHPDVKDLAVGAWFDPSGSSRILSTNSKLNAKIWDRAANTVVELLGHVGEIHSAAWSPRGDQVITTSGDGTARIWDARSGDTLAIIPHPKVPRAASFSPNGAPRFVVVGQDGTAAIHELPGSVDLETLARVLRCRVPFQVEDGRLMRRTGELPVTGCESK